MRHALLSAFFSLLISTAAIADTKEFPFREDSGLSKAEYMLVVGKYSAAIDAASEVLKRRPDNADAMTYRGYAYYKLGQMEDATKDFKTALSLKSTHLGANKYLANVYLESGKVQQAIEQMQVIRMVCGKHNCAELDALEAEIDAYRHAAPAEKPAEEKK